jgi:hypothetical protein
VQCIRQRCRAGYRWEVVQLLKIGYATIYEDASPFRRALVSTLLRINHEARENRHFSAGLGKPAADISHSPNSREAVAAHSCGCEPAEPMFQMDT